jgi:hypothetical protein
MSLQWMIYILPVLLTITVLAGLIAIYGRISYSPLDEALKPKTRDKSKNKQTPWKGLDTEDFFQTGAIGFIIGALISVFLPLPPFYAVPITALIGFFATPWLISRWIKKRFFRNFDRQYLRVLKLFVQFNQTNPIQNCFLRVAEALKRKSYLEAGEVFRYISDRIELGDMAGDAVLIAADKYRLPQLIPFAKVVRNLSERGGGENAIEVFENLIEGLREEQKHQREVRVETGQLTNEHNMVFIILIGLTCFFYSDAGIGASLLSKYWVPLVIGVIVLLIGTWYVHYRVKELSRQGIGSGKGLGMG